MNQKHLKFVVFVGLLFLVFVTFSFYRGLTSADPRENKDEEFVIPARGIDQQLARKIALRIARGYGNDDKAAIESLSQSSLSSLPQSGSLLGTPTDKAWQVTMSGKFTINEGSILIKAIHTDKMYAIIRARDGEVLAVGTVGPTTAEINEAVKPSIEK